jgi:hypothetical protein
MPNIAKMSAAPLKLPVFRLLSPAQTADADERPLKFSRKRAVKIGSGSIWWGERPREPGLMGFIAKIGSPGVSPHPSWLKLENH